MLWGVDHSKGGSIFYLYFLKNVVSFLLSLSDEVATYMYPRGFLLPRREKRKNGERKREREREKEW